LGRYYSKVLKRGLLVKAIVYLTLTPDKKIDLKKSVKDENLRKTIEDENLLLIPVCVINEKDEPSFSNDFMGECINSSVTDIAKVYYSEYKELITYLGGNNMTMDLDRDAIIHIYTDKEKLACFNMFGNLWEKRKNVIRDIIKDELKENDFQIHLDDKKAIYCKIDGDVSLGFYDDFAFGFIYTPGAKKFSKKTTRRT
jgi:hypothetical protein